MNDEELRKEFPGNSYTNIEPSSSSVPDLEPGKTQMDIPAQKPKKRGEPGKKKTASKPKKLTIGESLVMAVKSIDPSDIFKKIVYDWVFPGLQAAGEEILRIIFNPNGTKSNSRGSNRNGGRNRGYYNSIYDGSPRRASVGTSTKPQVIFSDRSEAEQVLSAAAEFIDDYGQVTLKDFYSLIDEITDGEISIVAEYPTRGYGWRNIEAADISRVSSGWLLTMPKVEVL